MKLMGVARNIARDFSRQYKSPRNPHGKERIVVYGGDREKREIFLGSVSDCLFEDFQVDALVLDCPDQAILDRDKDTYYVDFRNFFKV
jgi:hypothetical protein